MDNEANQTDPEQPASEDGSSSAAPPDGAEYRQRRVLVADDEAVIRTVVEQIIMTRLGCEVTCVESGTQVLQQLDEGAWDVLVTDMMMPGVHGLELVAAVHDKHPDTDVIVMTGYADNFPYVEVVNAGACDFITKPHQPAELEAKLIRIFNERDTRDALLLAETKYRSLFEFNVNGMLLLEAGSLVVRDVNDAFVALSGRNREDILGRPLGELLDKYEQSRFEQGIALFAQGGQGTLGDMLLVRSDGQELSLDVSVTFIDVHDEKIVFLAFKDVTEKREVERQLAEVAQTDKLTGLSNKYTFQTRIEWGLARARSEKFPMTLMALDLDNFKVCNDTYGHLVGDDVLAMVGEIIRDCIRAGGDEGFRCGGDEFAVVLMGAEAAVGKRVAERMISQFEKAENYGTSLSIGVAQYREDMHATDLIRSADKALYKAKNAGKGIVQVAD